MRGCAQTAWAISRNDTIPDVRLPERRVQIVAAVRVPLSTAASSHDLSGARRRAVVAKRATSLPRRSGERNSLKERLYVSRLCEYQDIEIAAKLGRAVKHARLAAHE